MMYFLGSFFTLLMIIGLIAFNKEGQEEISYWAEENRTCELTLWIILMSLCWPLTFCVLVWIWLKGK